MHKCPVKRRACVAKAVKKRRDYVTKVMRRYKIMKGCRNCTYREDPTVLEFDHIDPTTKKHEIANLVRGPCSFKRIKKELKKCQVLCKPCHIQKTKNDAG